MIEYFDIGDISINVPDVIHKPLKPIGPISFEMTVQGPQWKQQEFFLAAGGDRSRLLRHKRERIRKRYISRQGAIRRKRHKATLGSHRRIYNEITIQARPLGYDHRSNTLHVEML